MNAEIREMPVTTHHPVEQQICRLLEQRPVVSLRDLAAHVPSAPEALGESLEALCRREVITRLRPVGLTTDDYDYYRLKRTSDSAYLWELDCHLEPVWRRPDLSFREEDAVQEAGKPGRGRQVGSAA